MRKIALPSLLKQTFLDRVQSLGTSNGYNLIAFSGGVDSSVVAAGVNYVFPNNSLCIIGSSQSLPTKQLELARSIAKHIGIKLDEVLTKEGNAEEYLKNEGMSCYSCKTHLYSALRDVYSHYVKISSSSLSSCVIFNGTNLDDKKDHTRVGLIAANEFKVASPLDHLTKEEVRKLAFEFDLPNHAHAASPCLRSRLAIGVRATPSALKRIEDAEDIVRNVLSKEIKPHHNIRVRHLRREGDGGVGARVELDESLLIVDSYSQVLISEQLSNLGFTTVSFGQFKSGSVAIK